VVSLLRHRLDLQRFDEELDRSASTVITAVDTELDDGSALAAAALDTERELAIPRCAFAIDDGGQRMLASRLLGLPAASLTSGARKGLRTFTAESGGAWRGLAVVHTHNRVTYRVIVAESLQPVEADAAVLRDAMLLGIPIAGLLAAMGGWWIARQSLRPITQLAAQASRMTGSQPGARLDAPRAADELGALTTAFNALLGRLEDALKSQRQFMTDASHELRTPVSVVRTSAEVVLDRPSRTEDEYRDALTIVGEQSRRLAKLVDDMFLLARADAGARPLVKSRFYLDELAGECVRAARVLADARGVTIVCALAGDVEVEADEDLLRRLIMNLVSNAVRHTAAKSGVTVTLTEEREWIDLRVRDAGPGIPPEEHDRIFERFVRLPAMGAQAAPQGGGLGLPIARWIADAHGGSLTLVESTAAGSVFAVRLPIARGAA
jgi:heavy metal sensor kinase